MSQNPLFARVAEELRPGETQLGDFGLFFRKFIEKGRGISSFVPSSRTMARKMLSEVDFSRPGTIIELGAGTGAVTEHVVERLRPHHRFIAVENDRDFVEVLRRRFPEQMILQADATRLAEPLAALGVQRARYILCGLPTPAFSRRSLVRFMRWVRSVLEPDGLFMQLTIVPLIYKRFYGRLFEQVRYRMVWRNVPPGGVYQCVMPRPTLRRVAAR